jgi:hypothetical protein
MEKKNANTNNLGTTYYSTIFVYRSSGTWIEAYSFVNSKSISNCSVNKCAITRTNKFRHSKNTYYELKK